MRDLEKRIKSSHTHAGTAQGSSVGVGPDTTAEDVDARSIDIDKLAEVGELSTAIIGGVNSTDSDGVGG